MKDKRIKFKNTRLGNIISLWIKTILGCLVTVPLMIWCTTDSSVTWKSMFTLQDTSTGKPPVLIILLTVLPIVMIVITGLLALLDDKYKAYYYTELIPFDDEDNPMLLPHNFKNKKGKKTDPTWKEPEKWRDTFIYENTLTSIHNTVVVKSLNSNKKYYMYGPHWISYTTNQNSKYVFNGTISGIFTIQRYGKYFLLVKVSQ